LIIFELTNTEEHKTYQALEISNGNRQYDFLRSIVRASLELDRPLLSQDVIMALNYHAIVCLHSNPGQYRPCAVAAGEFPTPDAHRVPTLMSDFINDVNRNWEKTDAGLLCAYVIWRLIHIHPFINGNGRTARAAGYLVLCLKLGGLLKGEAALPELLRRNRSDYLTAVRHAQRTFVEGRLDLKPLQLLIVRLTREQIGQTEPSGPTPSLEQTLSSANSTAL
jgi:Fic family protein